MNAKNLGDKYVKTLQIRINQEQLDFVEAISKMLGVTPSEYVRMIINVYMSNFGGKTDENDETDINNKL